MKISEYGIVDYERKLPCNCGHDGNRHWHRWTAFHKTIGDFSCHFIGCDCTKYKELSNLEYLEWKYNNQNWLKKLWNKYAPNTKRFPEN